MLFSLPRFSLYCRGRPFLPYQSSHVIAYFFAGNSSVSDGYLFFELEMRADNVTVTRIELPLDK